MSDWYGGHEQSEHGGSDRGGTDGDREGYGGGGGYWSDLDQRRYEDNEMEEKAECHRLLVQAEQEAAFDAFVEHLIEQREAQKGAKSNMVAVDAAMFNSGL